MNELDDGRQIEALVIFVVQSSTGQQQQHRAKALSSCRDDVSGHLTDQRNARVKPARNDFVYFKHVTCNESGDVND